MSSNIHEAAERLRRTSVSDPMYNNAHDQALLAAEMLRLLNPAPFTAEALEARGGKQSLPWEWELQAGEHWMTFRFDGDICVAVLIDADYKNLLLPSVRTLGQLDALLFALKGEGK